jgi:predicted GNAT family acetyltransferase
MTDILRNPSLDQIKQAIELNMHNFFSIKEKEVEDSSINFIKTENYAVLEGNLPFTIANMVYHTKIPSDILEEKIEEIINLFESKDHPFFLMTGSITEPENLAEILSSKYGFRQNNMPGMYIELSKIKDVKEIEELEIVKVTKEKQLDIWNDILLVSFSFPKDIMEKFFLDFLAHKNESNYNAFLGYYQEKPVAVSLVCYNSGVAGIYCVGTVEEARGKGIGTAMTHIALVDAKKRGYEIAILQSSEMGYSVYKKMGFEDVCLMLSLNWNPKKEE